MNSYILYDTISATIVVGGQARIRLNIVVSRNKFISIIYPETYEFIHFV